MSVAEIGRSRWALSQTEVIYYFVVMLIAIVAPFSGLVFRIDFGWRPINVLSLLWPLAGLACGAVYLGLRRRPTAADEISDQFFER